jgi:hypothetical protein
MQDGGPETPERWRIGNRLSTREVVAEIMTERNAQHGAIRLFYKA